MILGAELFYFHDSYYRGLIGRTTVYRTVTRERRVVPAEVELTRRTVPEVQYTVGGSVPSTVVLDPLPESVYVETPGLPRYKYFYVNNQLVLVDPVTSQVVDVIDR